MGDDMVTMATTYHHNWSLNTIFRLSSLYIMQPLRLNAIDVKKLGRNCLLTAFVDDETNSTIVQKTIFNCVTDNNK